jgi:tetratricopeptide (TPR) repeat protein
MNKGVVWWAGALSLALAASTAPGASAENRAMVPEAAASKADLATESGRALIAGDAERALAKAEEAIRKTPNAGFAHYCKAEALAQLKRHDEAVTAYEAASAKLPAADERAREQAMWGRALALRATGRCADARRAFGEYAVTVQARDPAAAAQALEHAGACR